MEIKEIINLYNIYSGHAPQRVEKLPGAGSSRRYYKVSDGDTEIIATFSDNRDETSAFIVLCDYLHKKGYAVPEVLTKSETDSRLYLQNYGGNACLLDVITEMNVKEKEYGRDSEVYLQAKDRVIRLLKNSLDALIDVQMSGAEKECSEVICSSFDARRIKWDLNYFKYEFVKPLGVEFREDKLEDDFDRFAADLLVLSPCLQGFMYRDFQSRNILIDDNDRITLIDFQGGSQGPVIYDLVSLLWQAKANLPDSIREMMVAYYNTQLEKNINIPVEGEIRRVLPKYLLLRTLQVLGAYGFRGLVEKKAHFIESIPYALDNLKELVGNNVLSTYPELERVCKNLIELKSKFMSTQGARLRVEVFSFSYKRGYPADYTGNGGGFMFDCRGLHNPGRYEEYKQLTGLDNPVIEFLESRGEVGAFLDAAWQMVNPAVACYERRGFKNLQIGFGCTGGRHRSVYCAQHLAERLAVEFPGVEISLNHRERGIKTSYNVE